MGETMTISREDVLLGDRFPEDKRAYIAQQARVHRLRTEEWDRIRKTYLEKLSGEEGKLHRLAGAMNESSSARARVELSVDHDLRNAVVEAEIAQRAAHARLPEIQGVVNTLRNTLERLTKGGAEKATVSGQKKAIAEREVELAGLRAEAKKADGRLEGARKALNAAIEALRKDVLAQE